MLDDEDPPLAVYLIGVAPPLDPRSPEARWIGNRQGQLLMEQYELIDTRE